MKKGYAFVAIFSIILYAIAMEKESFSGVHPTYSEKYESFDKAFSQRFENTDDVWLVLGNRGTRNYYRERFSENWIFWDDYSSADSIGISGDFMDPKNWKQVSKILPKKVNYIAVDFNDLVSHPKRNDIIRAAKDVLNSEGMFCIEDDYDNRKKRFQHFTDKDFEQLSKDFDIKYAYWDGYISALPYTSDQSADRKSDMYKGLETMILRLASAGIQEKRRLLPYITPNLYVRSFLIKKNLTKKLVRDIIDSPYLNRMIQRYEDALEEVEEVEKEVEKKKGEIEALKKDIENYKKMADFSGDLSRRFRTLSKNINAMSRGGSNLSGTKSEKNSSFLGRVSKFVNKNNDQAEDLQKKLSEKQYDLSASEKALMNLQVQLDGVKADIKTISEKILKHYEWIFSGFERDKYLRPYVEYKKTELADIIADSKETREDFWDEYDSFWTSISETEILAKELEKSWSPDIIVQNLIPIEKIKSDADKKIADTSRVVILFVKK